MKFKGIIFDFNGVLYPSTITSPDALAPGAEELLNTLKRRGIPMTIATTMSSESMESLVDHLALNRWFSLGKLACCDDSMPSKPAPDVYLYAADLLGLQPSECVAIEDSQTGLTAAHAAGIGHIIAIGPQHVHELLKSFPGVDETIVHLDQVSPDILF